MNRNLFSAWYCLGVFVLSLATFWTAAPFVGMDRAKWSFLLIGLLILLPVFLLAFFRKDIQDERDNSFLHRALSTGSSNGFFASSVMALTLWASFYIAKVPTVSIDFIWLPVFSGFLVALLSFSVMLLLFYYKGEDADKENRI